MIKILKTLFFIVPIFLVGCATILSPSSIEDFSGKNAYALVKFQVDLGPRVPGSSAHSQCITWIEKTVSGNNWLVEKQIVQTKQGQITNIIAKLRDTSPDIILGAHYDSRLWADQDPETAIRQKPVPGANDGASGVAVLLEISRLYHPSTSKNVWIVFFDAEDQGGINNMDWIVGSRVFVSSLKEKPQKVVILDMVGDRSLNIYFERNSNLEISKQIWEKADQLGYSNIFIPNPKHSILDDHTPFLEAGIPSVDIIDFDYPYWHTVADTVDKVSPESLEAVGKTVLAWLLDQK